VGRAGRLEWFAQGFGALFATDRITTMHVPAEPSWVGPAVWFITLMTFGWLVWSVTIRRLHDLNRPASDCFKFCVPGLNFIVAFAVMFRDGDDETNEYGSPEGFFGLRIPLPLAYPPKSPGDS
jgi:uncharacterized membrane protein YhaH (DUF805 family)